MKDFKPRRRMIVNREVQYDVLMYVGVFVFSIFLLQAIATYLFISRIEEVISHLSAREFVARYKVSFLVYQMIPVGLGMLIGAYIFNRLTSRIAGPLYNMKRTLRILAESPDETPEIKLREDDYFHDEIEDVNIILRRRSK